NGLCVDHEGERMSTTKGNTVDPFQRIERFGAGVVRWFMMSNSPPWENIKFSERGVLETLRKYFNTLENVYSFFATYANIDGFTYREDRIPVDRRAELDRWIMSRLNLTISVLHEAYGVCHSTRLWV